MKKSMTIKSFLLSLVIVAVLYVPINVQATTEPVIGYIYLGDSRFVGMNNVVHMDEEENTFVVAKTGQGLRWLKKTAYDEILDIMDENRDIDEWVIISGLGINDGYNGTKYTDFYKTWDEDIRLILLSVNPLEKGKCDKYGYNFEGLNEGACKLNDALRDTDFEYLDTRRQMIQLGFETVDGVHYTSETYEFIYDCIQGYLND